MTAPEPRTKETNPKDALGCKKPPMSTVPGPVLYELGAAMLEGACKYGRHNYRVIGVRASIYFDAAFRHLMDWWEGEDLDPDSGLPHLAKAMACLAILRDADIRDMLQDDRPPASPASWMVEMQARIDDILKRYPEPLPPYTEQGQAQESVERYAYVKHPEVGEVSGGDCKLITTDQDAEQAAREIRRELELNEGRQS